jgi:hypothetical protein
VNRFTSACIYDSSTAQHKRSSKDDNRHSISFNNRCDGFDAETLDNLAPGGVAIFIRRVLEGHSRYGKTVIDAKSPGAIPDDIEPKWIAIRSTIAKIE